MDEAVSALTMIEQTVTEQDRQIAETMREQRGRLRSFIRRRVLNDADADDLLQEVFYELVEAQRLLKPIDAITSWLFRVARNRITDLFRKKKPAAFSEAATLDSEGKWLDIEELLPSPDAGPDALYLRHLFIEEFEDALAELPREQREVFVAHELEGRSFKEISAATGVGVNTLLARKHYAVLHLRERLHDLHDEFI
jgi:RNA polymerase sigma factor (sigma-70 family)